MYAISGSFEDIFELMFGPQQHDAHVKAHRREAWFRSRQYDFDAVMADMKAEGRRLATLNQPKPKFQEAAE